MQRRALFAGCTAPAASATDLRIPDVLVRDQDGRDWRFYSDLVRGRIVVINFFFVGCGGICPLVTENLRATQAVLGERVGRDVFFLSVALKPEAEPQEYVAAYARDWGAEPPGWRFLRAELAETEELRRALGFASVDPDLDRIADQHTGMVRMGNEAFDRWQACPGMSRPEFLAKSITTLLFPGGDARPEDRIGA